MMIRVFKHYIPKTLVALGFIEVAVFVAAVYLGVYLRFEILGEVEETSHGLEPIWLKAMIFAVVMFSAMTACGMYQRNMREGVEGVFLRLAISVVLATLAESMLFYLFPGAIFFGRGIFAISIGISIIAVIALRWIFSRVAGQETMQRRILVLGAGSKAKLLENTRGENEKLGLNILGYVAMPGENREIDEKKLLRLDVPLIEFVQTHAIDEIVVAVDDRRRAFPTAELLDCKLSGVDVIDLLTFYERQIGRVKLDILHPSWFIFSDGFSHTTFRRISKRIFDVAVSSTILFLTAPIMLLAMVIIYIDDPGPVFYGQVRVGDKWKLFRILKFRSMRVDAEKFGAQFATQNDPRVTRIGRFLRKTRIDELPQLFTVLKGDMSFVGPRPERPEFVERFSEKIPYYADRHRVKPGLTGWAQICYPYGASEKDAIEKLEYDLYYVKNYSLFLDLLIILQTAEVILWGKGAR